MRKLRLKEVWNHRLGYITGLLNPCDRTCDRHHTVLLLFLHGTAKNCDRVPRACDCHLKVWMLPQGLKGTLHRKISPPPPRLQHPALSGAASLRSDLGALWSEVRARLCGPSRENPCNLLETNKQQRERHRSQRDVA